MAQIPLKEFLAQEQKENGLTAQLATLIETVAAVTKDISYEVSRGALDNVLGLAGSENVQGEEQKKLDIISNNMMVKAIAASGTVSGMVSEEVPHSMPIAADQAVGPYLICFDPLDGSSNIDINVSIGTIFGVYPSRRGAVHDIKDEDFLQPGENMVAAGYAIYGPQTQLVFTLGRGVVQFTLDPKTNEYLLTRQGAKVSEQAKEFAINCSNMRHWEEPVRRYVKELLEGKDGPRGKDFNMRWVAALVAEVHRILSRGGIFMYPKDDRVPGRAGKLRLLYEGNPMSMLMEQAGAHATNGHQRILSIQPENIHQRVAVFLGAAEEVDLVTSYHKN